MLASVLDPHTNMRANENDDIYHFSFEDTLGPIQYTYMWQRLRKQKPFLRDEQIDGQKYELDWLIVL